MLRVELESKQAGLHMSRIAIAFQRARGMIYPTLQPAWGGTTRGPYLSIYPSTFLVFPALGMAFPRMFGTSYLSR